MSVGTENYPQTLCRYQTPSEKETHSLFSTFVSVWYFPVNLNPNLSSFLLFPFFFFLMKLNPIRVIKKMLGIPSLFRICFLKR